MANENIPYKIYLSEDEMPRTWYNVRADMKVKPAPLRNPATGAPMSFDDLRPVFCDELIRQELDNDDREIPIPDEIRDFYKMYRPSPLVRAYCLEKQLQTPAKIYYKFEGNNTSGSHKLNSAIAQAYYAKQQGLRGVTTETGAGQWGTALSMACAYLGPDCKVYMVKCSYEQKPFRREVSAHLRRVRDAEPVHGDGDRPSHPRRAPRHDRLARLRDQRGCRGRHLDPRLPLRARQRAQSGAAAPVGHRSGDENGPRQIRRRAGHNHRLRRRRQQPRRSHLPVHGREAARRA